MPSVARVQWAKIRVTLVAVAAVVILAVLLFQLFGVVLLAPKTVIYLYVPDASGLTNESPVRVDGIDVGRVSSVELSGAKEPNRVVKVTLLLYRDRLRGIPSDSVAQISSDTLIGDKFVDVNGGISATPIPGGGEMIFKFQPELLRSLDLTEFTKQLRLVDQTLTDIEEGRTEFGKFVQGEGFYDDLIRKLRDLQKGIRSSVSATSLAGSLLNTDDLNRQASAFLQQLDDTVAKIQSGQGAGGRMLRDSAQYDQLVSQAQAFRKSLQSLDKSDLIQSDTAWVNANRALADFIQKVDEFNLNPQLATTAVYENINGSLTELRNNLRDFRENPRKYLRLKVF